MQEDKKKQEEIKDVVEETTEQGLTEEQADDQEEAKIDEVETPEGVTVLVEEEEESPEEEEEEQDEEEVDELEDEEENHDSGAHDDFDWEAGNELKVSYSDKEIKDYQESYIESLSFIDEFEIVKAKIVSFGQRDVVLNLGYKSDGIVSRNEFKESEVEIGAEVDVFVEKIENDKGQLQVSHKKAQLLRTWEMIKDSYENGTIIKGTVVSKTKGGLIVDIRGLETFLPGSQIDIKPIIDYDAYVGKTMEFKVVKINEQIKNAVVSHKALIESDLAEQRQTIIEGLEKGQVLEGVVKNITDFGAFMDLGGIDGLLYITDISWGRINHPEEVLELNQKLNVVVLDFDENKKRISLGLKQLQPHPWDVVTENIEEGSVVKGKIVNIEDYGAFLEIEPGVEGLIHVSEVNWSNKPVNAREFFSIDQEYEAKVVTIDKDNRKMSLSLKQLTQDPWEDIEERFPVGNKYTGEVKNLTPYGVFVELDEGIGGMVHISDLSWTKRFSHPSEYTKIGENLEVIILEIDKENRKLTLGHKQLEENPWDTFENVFPEGSYHEATVLRIEEKGAIMLMPYGLEAFAPSRHIIKEDGNSAQVDEVLTVKVIEFNRDDKRLLVSHKRYLEDIKREAKDQVRSEKQKARKATDQVLKTTQSKMEKTTIGDLDELSQLRNELAGNTTADDSEE